MKTVNQTLTMLTLATAMTFSAACSKTIQREKILPAKASETKATAIEGTTDGGGGNAIDNRMLESYIVKPEELTASKVHLGTKIAKIFGQDQEPSGNAVFRFKTWYLVPTSLKNISKKALGIEFTEDQTQQVAIQTKDEVWIDANLFNKMTTEEQAKLILHEALMTFYMTKFMTLKELCDRNEKAGYPSCNMTPGQYKAIEDSFKPEKERPLEAQDYNAIRTMTSWLWESNSNLNKSDFHRIAKAAGFDKRFNYDEETSENSELRIKANKFGLILESARHGNFLPKKCLSVTSQKTFACEVAWTIDKTNIGGTLANGINIRLAVRDLATKTLIVDTILTVYDDVVATSYSSTEAFLKNVVITSSNLFGNYESAKGFVPAEAGTRGNFVNFVLNDKGDQLKGLLIIPLVNAGTIEEVRETTSTEGKKIKELCQTSQIVKRTGETIQEEPLLIGDETELMTQARLFEGISFGNSSNCKQIIE